MQDDEEALVAALLRSRPPRPPGGRQGRLRARAKLATGRPLLQDEPLDLDVAFVAELAAEALRTRRQRGVPGAEGPTWG